MQSEMPEDDADADADVQGVLCAELRYLQTEIRGIHHILTHAGNFIAEHHCISASGFRDEPVKHYRADGLFGAHHSIPFFLKTADGIHCIIDMFPCHAVLCSEG